MEKPEKKPLVVRSFVIENSSKVRVISYDINTGVPVTSVIVDTKTK